MATDHNSTGLEHRQSGVLAAASAFERIRHGTNLSGTVLAWGVAGPVFAVAILRTGTFPAWLGWLGLAFAGLVWLATFQLVFRPLEQLFLPMLLVGIVWLAALGIELIRMDRSMLPEGATGIPTGEVTFIQLGGAIELIALGLVVAGFIAMTLSDVPQPNPAPGEMATWLEEVAGADTTYRAVSWQLVTNHLLEIVFIIALYRVFIDVGSIMFFAMIAGVLGLLLVAISGLLQLGLAEMAGRFTGRRPADPQA